MSGQRLEMVPVSIGERGIAQRRAAERRIKVILRRFKMRGRCPKQWLSPQRGFERRSTVPSEEASLQLSNPIPALRRRQTCVARQMPFEHELIESLIVETTEFRRQTTKSPDKPELRGDE